jgi:hypothetical protein
MVKATYAAGDALCCTCERWIFKDDIERETYTAAGEHNILLHKECGFRLRYKGRHKPHLFQRVKARDPTYTMILNKGLRSEILKDLDKWENLISPRHYNSRQQKI